MLPGPDAQLLRTRLMIWWIIWASVLAGLIVIYFFLGRGPQPPVAPDANPLANLIGLVPLFVSIVIRWLALPRASGDGPALILFIIGLSLAEACGLLGVFLGGPYREDLFVLGVLGVTQFVPLNARKWLEPKPQGFIPNN
jgi:magnesium-transporting ATPase (P-type)